MQWFEIKLSEKQQRHHYDFFWKKFHVSKLKKTRKYFLYLDFFFNWTLFNEKLFRRLCIQSYFIYNTKQIPYNARIQIIWLDIKIYIFVNQNFLSDTWLYWRISIEKISKKKYSYCRHWSVHIWSYSKVSERKTKNQFKMFPRNLFAQLSEVSLFGYALE